jgi:hypothetical protein
MTETIDILEQQLNHFSLQTRTNALQALLSLADQGEIDLPPTREVANMHCHTFYSFNGYGYSPTALAWLARKKGFKLIGSVDFDVLDAVDEFLTACDTVGVRASCGLETRVYVPEFATREINSPGEPGVAYHMGIGFASSSVPKKVAPILDDMRQRAEQRNRDMLARINAHLDPLSLDYDHDVLPLTPAGNATERHMLAAYLQAAEAKFADPVSFWAGKLNLSVERVSALMQQPQKFANEVRARLMKRGGVGYVQPGPNTFPTVDELHELVEACGALPCVTWLDGLSEGEQAMEELLELMIGKGAVALNIVPDRNWNIADPELKQIKLQKLIEVVELARQFDLPLNVGTEMNAFGQKLVDDFDAPELAPVRDAFLAGAYFIYGHTVLHRAAGMGYQSGWARSQFHERREYNDFYTKIGRLVEPGRAALSYLERLSPALSATDILDDLKD